MSSVNRIQMNICMMDDGCAWHDGPADSELGRDFRTPGGFAVCNFK